MKQRDDGIYLMMSKKGNVKLPEEVMKYLDVKSGDNLECEAIGSDVVVIRKHIED